MSVRRTILAVLAAGLVLTMVGAWAAAQDTAKAPKAESSAAAAPAKAEAAKLSDVKSGTPVATPGPSVVVRFDSLKAIGQTAKEAAIQLNLTVKRNLLDGPKEVAIQVEIPIMAVIKSQKEFEKISQFGEALERAAQEEQEEEPAEQPKPEAKAEPEQGTDQAAKTKIQQLTIMNVELQKRLVDQQVELARLQEQVAALKKQVDEKK